MSYSINQATGVGASGDGKALDGAWLGRAITITGDPGMVEWEHTFRDKPPGSSATMTNASSQVATFTPDVAGDTYRVRLRERATPNGTWITTTKVIRVARDNAGALVNYGICSISFDEVPGEANYASNATGIASRARENNAAIVAAIGDVDGSVTEIATPTRQTIGDSSAAQTTAAGARWFTREAKTAADDVPKPVTILAPEDPSVSGEERAYRTRPGRAREYLISPDGAFISWATNAGEVRMRWRADLGAGGRWQALRVYASHQVYRPEDYAVLGPVGVGVAANDDAAWLALRADVETSDEAQLAFVANKCTIEVFGQYETLTGWKLRAHWGRSDILIKGAGSGYARGVNATSLLSYVGTKPVVGYHVSLAFNRTNRTIQRLDGQAWPAQMVGTRLRVTRGPSAANIRIHNTITSITTTSTANDTLVVAAPIGNPVAGYDTSGAAPTTEASVACDWIQWVSIFEAVGAHGIRMDRFNLLSNDSATGFGKVTNGLWVSFHPDDEWVETSSNNIFEGCSVDGIMNVPGASGVALGNSAWSPVVGSQCDSARFLDSTITCCIDYGAVGRITVSGNVFTCVDEDGVTPKAHGLVANEPVRLLAQSYGLLPSAVNTWTAYYVRYLTTTTFEVSLTRGGAAHALVSTGSGLRRVRRPLHADGIEHLQGNNVKSNHVERCKISAVRRHVNFELATDGGSAIGCQFDASDEACVVTGSSGFLVSGCNAERVAAGVWSSFNGAPPVRVQSSSFNITGQDNNWAFFRGRMTLDDVYVEDLGTNFAITSVDTGANTITFTLGGSETVMPSEGQRVVVRNALGYTRTPGNVSHERDYYLTSLTTSGSSYTAQLTDTSTLVVVDLTTSGTGTQLLTSEIGWRSGASASGTFGAQQPQMRGCTFVNNGRFPRITLSNDLPVWNTYAVQGPQSGGGAMPAITARGNTALIGGIPHRICDIDPEDSWVWPAFHNSISDMAMIKPGRLSCIELDWRKVASAGGAAVRNAFPPKRCGIKAVYAEVVPDDAGVYGFGGGAISAATLSVGYNGTGNLLTAFDVLAGSFATASERRWGFQSAQVGSLLKGADTESKTYWPFDGGADPGWAAITNAMDVTLTITGAAMSALTSGRVRLYFLWEPLPEFQTL